MKDVGTSTSDNLRAYANPRLPMDATLARSIGDFILDLTPARKSRHAN